MLLYAPDSHFKNVYKPMPDITGLVRDIGLNHNKCNISSLGVKKKRKWDVNEVNDIFLH